MPAFDLVRDCTISPAPGIRVTVPSMLRAPASTSTFVQSECEQFPDAAAEPGKHNLVLRFWDINPDWAGATGVSS